MTAALRLAIAARHACDWEAHEFAVKRLGRNRYENDRRKRRRAERALERRCLADDEERELEILEEAKTA